MTLRAILVEGRKAAIAERTDNTFWFEVEEFVPPQHRRTLSLHNDDIKPLITLLCARYQEVYGEAPFAAEVREAGSTREVEIVDQNARCSDCGERAQWRVYSTDIDGLLACDEHAAVLLDHEPISATNRLVRVVRRETEAPPPMRRFRAKPVEVEAVRWDGTHEMALRYTPYSDRFLWADGGRFECLTANGSWATINPGDWIMWDSMGYPYPCSDEVLQMRYEAVEG